MAATKPGPKRISARRLGLLAAGVFMVTALGVLLGTVLPFRLRAEQIMVVVVLELAVAAIAGRNTYVGVSRLVDPTWPVDRLSYSTSTASIDGELHTISTASHLVSAKWSRAWSTFVVSAWASLWTALAGGFLAWGILDRGLRTFG